jgi:two-component system sensor histidine kinase KdpD
MWVAKNGGVKRGQLKIFLGYATGASKTRAMLYAARVAVANGRDVLVGCVDSGGRPEIEGLLAGFKVLPLKKFEYRGVEMPGFDLDAALERKAELVLVGGLAHTNAAGCRNHKRWQDVEELLARGSDVWTTLDVQHIESLRDVVVQITGAVVRDTVPDRVFDEATEVELVDLPSDELRDASRDGNVQASGQCERGAGGLLSEGSLLTLREIATRRVAGRVGRGVQEVGPGRTRAHAWPAVERLMVCVDSSLAAAKLVRTCDEMAAAAHSPWVAVHVENASQSRLDERRRNRLVDNMTLAGQLGAEVVTLTGRRIADEIVRYAQAHNVTKIVIGRGDGAWWHRLRRRSVAERVIRMSGGIDVHVVPGVDLEDGFAAPAAGIRRGARDYVMAAGLLVLASGVAAVFDALGLTDANLVMTYLLAIVLVATWWGRGPAIASSVASVLLYNFLFTTPYYTLVVDDPQYVYTFAVMLTIALIVSALTSRAREQAKLASDRERRTEALYRVSHALASTSGRLHLVAVAQKELEAIFGGKVVVFALEGDTLQPLLGRGHGLDQAPVEHEAAQSAFATRRMAGRGTDTAPAAQAIYLPLNGLSSTFGVLGWQPEDDMYLVDIAQRQLLDAVSTQIALALERDWLAQETQRVLTEADAERTRSSLLSVVSHDLRTPLAAIAGSASSLVVDKLDAETRNELARTIYEEADRLSRLVDNLLHFTRIESGAVKVEKQWQPLEEAIGSALRRVEPALKGHDVRLDLPSDLPLVPMDGLLVEQVLVNLLDNAAKYSADGLPIDLSARLVPAGVEATVGDRGPGIEKAERERVFEKFYRSPAVRSDRGRGAGMGLAICRAIVTAHGGRIWVEPRDGGGACFKFVLPVEGVPPEVRQDGGAPKEVRHS